MILLWSPPGHTIGVWPGLRDWSIPKKLFDLDVACDVPVSGYLPNTKL